MRITPDVNEVRSIVRRTFQEFGAAGNPYEVDETILIDDGKLVGRSYRADSLMAMWLMDIGILQFYDAEGAMLRTINLLEEMAPQRVAA